MTKVQATDAAEKLLKRMTSPGWRTHVWINSGWHYLVYNGCMAIYPAKSGEQPLSYFCLLDSDVQCLSGPKQRVPSCGAAYWSSGKFTSSDPNDVVKQAVCHARNFVDRATRVVLDAEAILNEKI